jgi:hypothetical protein
VNFNGTGTVAIRASGNVSSITDNGTGDYTVNFTTAMPDADYTLSGVGAKVDGNYALCIINTNTAMATGAVRIYTLFQSAGAPTVGDNTINTIIVHR